MFSSPKGAFNVMIYMHRYNADTVSVILNNYLRTYKDKLSSESVRQKGISESSTSSSSDKTKALKEIDSIKVKLDELNDYERDVLYPMATQRIDIDLDDGVKVNYAKLQKAVKGIKL